MHMHRIEIHLNLELILSHCCLAAAVAVAVAVMHKFVTHSQTMTGCFDPPLSLSLLLSVCVAVRTFFFFCCPIR